MGHPRTVKRYNSMWFELFDRFLADENKEIEVDCEDERTAKALRLEFYKVRTVIAGDRDVEPEDPGLAAVYGAVLNSREVKVRGNKVVFSHRDHNWLGRTLEKALGE